MAKTHQDQVNWPYPPHFYPQPHSYNLPYPHGRVCQESCCRRSRGPLAYPPHMTALPPAMPCRSAQDNAYPRPQVAPQVRGFVPVNPYLQQHAGHGQHPQSAVHRPIPQGRYDYNDFYRYGSSSNTNNNNNVSNNHNQGFHPAVLKQNPNPAYGGNPPHPTEQYPACSHYTPQEQEPAALPSLDVRQFLATWQDKDEEVFEPDQQSKAKVQYQELPPSNDVFKPLDCTKRTEPTYSMYGYNQMNNHPAYYNKPMQGLPNHQAMNETSFKTPSYISNPYHHPVPVENDCSYNNSQVPGSSHIVDSDPQHVGYERKIEKIYNPHGCKSISVVPPNDQSHCAVEKSDPHNMDLKVPPNMPDKTQYHLSASLECEDLFDDINRKKEERQRNIVHPLSYQDTFSQRNGSIRPKPDIPQVSVKPNTTTNVNFSVDSFTSHSMNMEPEADLKKPKALPLKKWVQKRKKSDDEFFPSFNIGDPTLDFSSRDTVIERSHIQPQCDSSILSSNDPNSCNVNIPESINHISPENNFVREIPTPGYPTNTNNSEKTNDCIYASVNSLVEPEPQINPLSNIACPVVTPSKVTIETNQALTISSDDIDISIASSCDLAVGEDHRKDISQPEPNYFSLDDKKQEFDEQNIKCPEGISDQLEKDDKPQCSDLNMVLDGEGIEEVIIENESRELLDDHASSSSNALKTIAYMYDDENNVSENSVDSSQTIVALNSKLNNNSVNLLRVKRSRLFNSLSLWRYRNRLFSKPSTKKKGILMSLNKSKYRIRCLREFSKFCIVKKKKSVCLKNIFDKSGSNESADHDSDVVNVLSSIVDDVCQIGELSLQIEDPAPMTLNEVSLSPGDNKHDAPNGIDGNCNVVGWEHSTIDKKITSPIVGNASEEYENTIRLNEEYIGYAEGSTVEGQDDRVLHGILNWPHQEEEITSINEKESIKVSLPWVKIFKPHADLPEDGKTLEIGPARIELRYSPAPVEYQPGHFKANRSSVEKKSSVFSVKKVLLKHNSAPAAGRLPKMVIKKTGCEEYKSYIKDAKLRVISIKNSNKDGQAEVIIETDRPLIESQGECGNLLEPNECVPEKPSCFDSTDVVAGSGVSDMSPETDTDLHHCLLCQESFTSLDKLRSHENSLSHRHIDIIQRSVLHKLQKSFKGLDFPEFQPLSATEIEYLNWRPNFSGYNHFYHNGPL